MSKANSSKVVCTCRAQVLGIDAVTGKERMFSASVTVRGQNPRAKATKAALAQLRNQKYWLLLTPVEYVYN